MFDRIKIAFLIIFSPQLALFVGTSRRRPKSERGLSTIPLAFQVFTFCDGITLISFAKACMENLPKILESLPAGSAGKFGIADLAARSQEAPDAQTST